MFTQQELQIDIVWRESDESTVNNEQQKLHALNSCHLNIEVNC